MQSTTIIAFDQHAATTVAAVLLPGHRTPALHPLTSDVATILRFVRRLRRQGCCDLLLRSGTVRFRIAARPHGPPDSLRRDCASVDPPSAGRSDQDGPARCGPPRGALSCWGADRDSHSDRAGGSGSRSPPVPRGHRADLLRARHRLSKFLLRHGRRFTATKKAWSKRHDAGLRAQTWPLAALDQTHRAYLRGVDEVLARLRDVETTLRALLDLAPLRARVQRLRCFRGIDDLTALTIAAELGDPRRFATAPATMAFVGLVPSEHSSGTKRAQGGITKTGNAHLRRVLVESAWHCRHHPFVSATLRARQRGAPAEVISRAWAAQQRLHRRYQRLAARGKPQQHIVTAVARELTASSGRR
jgi:Transposase IS116/IS110/IS902 family